MKYIKKKSLSTQEIRKTISDLDATTIKSILALLMVRNLDNVIGSKGFVKFTEDPEKYECYAFKLRWKRKHVLVYSFENLKFPCVVRDNT